MPLVRDFDSRWTRALRIAARHIRLHPAPAETLIVSAAMGIGILGGRVLSAFFEEPNKVCTSPRHFCDVSPTDLSILSSSQLSKRCHQACVQTGKQRIVEPGYTGRGSHSFTRTEYSSRTSLLPRGAAKPPLFAKGKANGLTKGNRKLWNDGKFDSKICDCRGRRTSSRAVLFSSGRGYRLYAVRIIEPCSSDFRKRR
jgi:hypothetical protein